MITYLKSLLFDEGRFVSLFRGALLAAGTYLAANPEAAAGLGWLGPALVALGGVLRSNSADRV